MRKETPYMKEAIEFAKSKGEDPFERVPKPNTDKTMPRWCTYKDMFAAEEKKLHSLQNCVKNDLHIVPVIFGTHADSTIEQLMNCTNYGDVHGAAICADGHLGYSQPVGGVIAYRNGISISGVGFDIACGNMAARTKLKYKDIKESVPTILNDINKVVSFGVGRKNTKKVENPLFDSDDLWKNSDMGFYKKNAMDQLGTVGSGNHYVDLLKDENDFVWIGVHFGSRGLGHTAATKYLKLAGGKDGINAPPTIVSTNTYLGESYIAAMTLAGHYAYAGREWVVNEVAKIIGATMFTDVIHNHHNYAWQENHFGENLWVVRKGATPAFPGQKGFIGGSMGDNAVIVEGVDSELSKRSYYSTVHGAGRLFGRKEAIRRFTLDEMKDWIKEKNVHVLGAGIDESPMAYRRLNEVLQYHSETVRILHTLTPFGVIMAGNELDPFKD